MHYNFDLSLERRSTESIKWRQYADDILPLWVADMDFNNPRKITDLGRQMDTFLWGKAELRDFLNSDGKPLEGILIKPENFDPKKKYPLMVLQWLIFPFTMVIFGSIPAIDAQTRLMLGKYLGFNVTAKKVLK